MRDAKVPLPFKLHQIKTLQGTRRERKQVFMLLTLFRLWVGGSTPVFALCRVLRVFSILPLSQPLLSVLAVVCGDTMLSQSVCVDEIACRWWHLVPGLGYLWVVHVLCMCYAHFRTAPYPRPIGEQMGW